jgi:hypothetical protein
MGQPRGAGCSQGLDIVVIAVDWGDAAVAEVCMQGLDGGKLSLVRVRKQHDIIGVEGDRMLSLSAVAIILARESITLSTMPAY